MLAALAGHEPATGVAAAQQVFQGGHVGSVERVGGRGQLAGQRADQRGDGRGVLAEHLDPQPRVAGGDPGGVLQPRAGQDQLLPLGGEHGGDRRRGDLGQVADPRDSGVVLLGGELDRLGAAVQRQVADCRERLRRGLPARAQHPRPAGEQRGRRGFGAGLLLAGHRVAAADAGEVDAGLRQVVVHRPLHRRDVAERPAPVRQASYDRGDGGRRRGHQAVRERLLAVPGPTGAARHGDGEVGG